MRYMHIFLVMIQPDLRLEKGTADVTNNSLCIFWKNLYQGWLKFTVRRTEGGG